MVGEVPRHARPSLNPRGDRRRIGHGYQAFVEKLVAAELFVYVLLVYRLLQSAFHLHMQIMLLKLLTLDCDKVMLLSLLCPTT